MKRDRALAWSFILITATAAALLAAALMPANSRASATTTIDKTFTCLDGFSSGCFKTGCMAEKQLKMSNNQYTLAFAVPKAGAYMCTVKVVANHFDFPEGKAETNEVTDIKLNGQAVGSTTDSWCPPGGTTKPPETGCDMNIECCGPRASTLDCNRYPESSSSCTEPKLLCDDDPSNLKLMISMGKEITMSLEKCNPGAVAFIREGSFKPRCQNWQFSTATVKSKGGQDVRCPVSATITGGKLIATYDCSITRNYNIKLDFLNVGKSYTMGVWAPFTATGWSSITVCATPIAPYYSETKADEGNGICIGGGPPPATCGNGIKESAEVCDCPVTQQLLPCDLSGQTCASLGYGAGNLACKSDCSGFDTSGCNSGIICNIDETLCGRMCCTSSQECVNNKCMEM